MLHKRSASSRKDRPRVGKAKRSGKDVGESCSYALRNKVSSSNNATVMIHDLQFHPDMAVGAKQTVKRKRKKRKR